MIDEKRHFEKPIELSPLVAIDRERCILCYRCVRFSQEVAEDEQLQLLERGDRTFVGTFDDRPYVAPFHGNITDLCPVGALTSYTYRFRARPWDIEQAGSVCTLCPSQCNVSFTVRDEQVKRVVARDNPEVDDGWLCDRGRYGFEMFGAEERVTRPAAARAAPQAELGGGDRARPPRACARPAPARRGDRRRRLQRGGLPGPADPARGARLAARRLAARRAGPAREALRRASPQPELSAKVRDIDEADAILVLGTDPLHSSPILDLRIRKAIRRNGARLAVATERPTALDGGAEAIARYAPGEAAALPRRARPARCGGAENGADAASPRVLRGRRARSSIVWGERIGREGEGAVDGPARRSPPPSTSPSKEGSGLLEVPESPTPAACARPAACPTPARASSRDRTRGQVDTEEIRAALESGELKALLLFGVDPLRDFPDTEAWEAGAHRRRPRRRLLDVRERDHRQGRRRLPARDPRRERRHRHPPRRPPAARPPQRRPPRRHPPELAGPRRALRWPSATTPASTPSPPPSPPSPRRSRSTPASPTPTSAAAASAGRTARSCRSARARSEAPEPARRTLSAEAPSSSAEPRRRSRSRVRRRPTLARSGTYRDLWAGPDHRAEPAAEVPEPAADGRAVARPTPSASGLKHGDEVRVGQNGTSVEAAVDDQGAGRRGRLLPDRGHRGRQRQRAAQRRPGRGHRSRRSAA